MKLVTLPPTGRNPQRVLQAAVHRWRLSPRQREVLTHLLDGDTNKQIAAKLGCAEVTVEFHLRGMFAKTGAENRTELLALCLRRD
jgi:DNA-binding CsgD family transcriptional regulator